LEGRPISTAIGAEPGEAPSRGRGPSTRFFLALATVLVVIGLLAPAPATAEDDYPPGPSAAAAHFEVEREAIAPGDIQRLWGEGWHPDCPVRITVTMPGVTDHTATLSPVTDGTWRHAFRVPSEARDGEAGVMVEGCDLATSDTVVLSATFTIDSGLPITGEDISRLTLLAGGLLILGTWIVIVSRSRIRGSDV
jgi:LPXTG-motif cell wall-anchored protein